MNSSKFKQIHQTINIDDDDSELLIIQKNKKIKSLNCVFSIMGMLSILLLFFLFHQQSQIKNNYQQKYNLTTSTSTSTPTITTTYISDETTEHEHKHNKFHTYVDVNDDHIYVKNWNGSIHVNPDKNGKLPNILSFENIDGDVHIG